MLGARGDGGWPGHRAAAAEAAAPAAALRRHHRREALRRQGLCHLWVWTETDVKGELKNSQTQRPFVPHYTMCRHLLPLFSWRLRSVETISRPSFSRGSNMQFALAAYWDLQPAMPRISTATLVWRRSIFEAGCVVWASPNGCPQKIGTASVSSLRCWLEFQHNTT